MRKTSMSKTRLFLMYFSLTMAFLLGLALFFPDAEEVDVPGGPVAPGISGPVVPHRTISGGEARLLMESGEPYILLDVRTEAEFDRRHIPGAILLPYAEIFDRAPAELEDRDARILLYCETGRRSANAAEALAALGFTNVYDFGGIAAWPYETVSG